MASTPFLSSCYSLATIPTNFLCKTSSLPPTLFHPHSLNHRKPEFRQYPNRIIRGFGERAEPRGSSKNNLHVNSRRKKLTPKANESGVEEKPPPSSAEVECVGTGLDVECVVNPSDEFSSKDSNVKGDEGLEFLGTILEWGLLISPFFFWGTAMVAMKEVLPKTGPFFVSAFRLVPAGLMLVGFAASKGRNFPSGFTACLSITLFALVDATCFQGFLAEGLQRTSAGLGSVIIDSQPLTVAVLAAFLFGESIGSVGAAGLVLGVIGLLLLEETR